MKRMIATALATAALAGAALAEEVNLRTLAVEDGSGNLVPIQTVLPSGRHDERLTSSSTATHRHTTTLNARHGTRGTGTRFPRPASSRASATMGALMKPQDYI